MRVYDPAIDARRGLSAAGRRIVREMNRLGMLVDVTHMVEESFWDTLEVSTAPVIASHGNARSLRDTVRYLTDEQIRAVAETGGIICPSPFPLGPTRERPSLEMMVRHVDHMVRLVGPDHVGFGTDFFGSDWISSRRVRGCWRDAAVRRGARGVGIWRRRDWEDIGREFFARLSGGGGVKVGGWEGAVSPPFQRGYPDVHPLACRDDVALEFGD